MGVCVDEDGDVYVSGGGAFASSSDYTSCCAAQCADFNTSPDEYPEGNCQDCYEWDEVTFSNGQSASNGKKVSEDDGELTCWDCVERTQATCAHFGEEDDCGDAGITDTFEHEEGEIVSIGNNDYALVCGGTLTCYECGDCDCPDGWSTTMPSRSVSTGDPCDPGYMLVEESKPNIPWPPADDSSNSCDTCYKCEECDEEYVPSMPGMWSFATDVGLGCPEECSDLMDEWVDGVEGWGNGLCTAGTGGTFVVKNPSCSKTLTISITSRPNMTVTMESFDIDGNHIDGGSGNFSFSIPPKCPSDTDITDNFSATYSCTCRNPISQAQCRGGHIAQPPTYTYA